MNITEREENNVNIFVLDGRVDTEGAVDLDLVLQATLAGGKYKIVIDMSNVSYLNSSGLRTLADILTQSQAHAGDLYLVSLNKKVERVFEIIGFDKFFKIFADVESALEAF